VDIFILIVEWDGRRYVHIVLFNDYMILTSTAKML